MSNGHCERTHLLSLLLTLQQEVHDKDDREGTERTVVALREKYYGAGLICPADREIARLQARIMELEDGANNRNHDPRA